MSCQQNDLCTCGCCEGIAGMTPLPLYNAPGLSSLVYRVGMHHSFKQSMLAALSVHPDAAGLTSRSDDDFAIATLDAWATVLDVLTFYQERIINEGYLRTATERFSVVELARHISYKPGNGVAASTFLSFTMSETPGAPAIATIPASTKVQSIPDPGEQPQVFETNEATEARVEWNAIPLQMKKSKVPVFGDKEIFLEGLITNLQPGDALLMIGAERMNDAGNENWDFRKIKEVLPNQTDQSTKITWENGLGTNKAGRKINPASRDFRAFVLRQRCFLFGYNATDFRLLPEEVKDAFYPSTTNPNPATDWKGYTIYDIADSKENVIHLDGIHSRIVPESWLVISKPDYAEVYEVVEAVESSRKNFGLSLKTTKVTLKGENLKEIFNDHIRDAVVFAQSEELSLTGKPDLEPPSGRILHLGRVLPDLPTEKTIIISGKRLRLELKETGLALPLVSTSGLTSKAMKPGDSLIVLAMPDMKNNGRTSFALQDRTGFTGTMQLYATQYRFVPAEVTDEQIHEVHVIKKVTAGTEGTELELTDDLKNYFERSSVTVHANIVAATHGETKTETLGSGNASALFQQFRLKQKPLTFVSAATPGGNASTLGMRVNDVLWKEVRSLYGATSADKVYSTAIADNGDVTIQTGDGITGSRLPTGVENIKATYRIGIGKDGLLKAGQLSMLMESRLGPAKVTNPLPATGAADPETIATARRNAPVTVLTLDRIVSVKDFGDFARAFAGIGKARADLLWNGERQMILITIAGDKQPVDEQGAVYAKLRDAVKASGHTYQSVEIRNYTPLSFSVNARVAVVKEQVYELVKERILQSLKEKFSFGARDFGQQVTPAEVVAVIQNVEGVLYVDLELLNGANPFAKKNFRLNARVAEWNESDGVSTPAELLLIDPENIIITEI